MYFWGLGFSSEIDVLLVISVTASCLQLITYVPKGSMFVNQIPTCFALDECESGRFCHQSKFQ